MADTLRPLCKHDPAQPRAGCPSCARWQDPGPLGESYRAAIAGRQNGGTHYERTGTPMPPAAPVSTVGDKFKELVATLGFTAFRGCSCESLRVEMNRLGPAVCRARIDDLVKQVEGNASQVGWVAKIKAAGLAVANGIVVNPADPVRGLILMACEGAEEAGRVERAAVS